MNACCHCGSFTKNRKFCSRSCAAKLNNVASPKRERKQRFCASCGRELEWKRHGQTFCPKCSDERASPLTRVSRLSLDEIKHLTLKIIQERYGAGKSLGKNRNATVRYYANVLNRDLKQKFGRCQVCNYNVHVELCHIKPIKDFDEESTLEEINGETNLLVLCPNHHWEFDAGIISLDSIPLRSSTVSESNRAISGLQPPPFIQPGHRASELCSAGRSRRPGQEGKEDGVGTGRETEETPEAVVAGAGGRLPVKDHGEDATLGVGHLDQAGRDGLDWDLARHAVGSPAGSRTPA
jgi:predicted RNA-binding Zn-ribbon protein involved in translation (DUF1610 family)